MGFPGGSDGKESTCKPNKEILKKKKRKKEKPSTSVSHKLFPRVCFCSQTSVSTIRRYLIPFCRRQDRSPGIIGQPRPRAEPRPGCLARAAEIWAEDWTDKRRLQRWAGKKPLPISQGFPSSRISASYSSALNTRTEAKHRAKPTP